VIRPDVVQAFAVVAKAEIEARKYARKCEAEHSEALIEKGNAARAVAPSTRTDALVAARRKRAQDRLDTATEDLAAAHKVLAVLELARANAEKAIYDTIADS
jgi:hypothetical protein